MKKFLIIIISIITSISTNAADRRFSQFYFSKISGEDGLSQSNVKTILQDSYGFMWFGTKNGLNRYDGVTIIQKDVDDLELGVGNHNISALYEDSERQLWIGTDRGVYRYNPTTDKFSLINIASEESGVIMNNWVANIVGDLAGNIWIVIPDQGIFCYKDNKLYYYEVTNKAHLKSESPQCITVRANGEVWVGTWGVGLFRYNPTTDMFENYIGNKANSLTISEKQIGGGKTSSLVGKNISAICDYGDYIAIACYEGELYKFNPKDNSISPIKIEDGNIVRQIYNFDNELWLCTRDGIFIINEEKGKPLHLIPDSRNPYSLSDNDIFCIYSDNDNSLWIGTMFGGVNYLANHDIIFDKYISDNSPKSLNSNRIREIGTDSSGLIWIGTEDRGINAFNPKTGQFHTPKIAGNYIDDCQLTLSIYAWDNKIACGLVNQGLYIFDNDTNTGRLYSSRDLRIADSSVYSFFVDKSGTIWIGTGWGLYKADSKSYVCEKINEVGYDWIFDTFQDSNGNIWFASMGSGLWLYNPEKNQFKKYTHKEGDDKSLSSNSLSSIMEDHKGQIWISTDRGGICRYNRSTDDFTTFSIKEGMPDNVAYKILEDDKHNLWFGTNRGLVCFNPENGKIKVYTTHDGILSNQFNYKSATKGNDGKFYFGSINGLIAFNPNTIGRTKELPPVYISKFSINNEDITVHSPDSPLTQSIEFTDNLTLRHDQTNISFNVALLNYSSAKSNLYEYKLEPLDKNWIKVGDNKNITYAKLPTGNYTLVVRATNGHDNESYVTKSLDINILPPWWRSTWANIIYIILLIAGIWAWFLWYQRRKNKELQEQQRLFAIEKENELAESKLKFFTEIAHEIRTPLTLINGPMEAIDEMEIKEPKLRKNLNVIRQNANRLLDLARQLLDFQKIGSKDFDLKFEIVDITKLLNDTVARFEPTIEQRNKTLSCNIPDNSIVAAIDREAITKILSNLLNNALKYSDKIIQVNLKEDETNFIIEVTSDGKKIPEEFAEQIFEPFYQLSKDESASRSGVGIGLPLARSLAKLHKGTLLLDTVQSQNTFILTIPLNKDEIQTQIDKVVDQHITVLDEESSAETSNGINAKLLLVEDDHEMRDFIRERLQEEFLVEIASNGVEAMEVIHKKRIDLVITDIMMPKMDGYELCKAIKTDMEICHTPIIFLTAKNDLESKIKGLKLGAEAYVEKPFSFNHLKSQILSLLSNRRNEREAFSKLPLFPVNDMQMSKADEEFMNKAIAVIQENIADENFNVERMAEILCMSRSSLLRKIKMQFNLSPVDFIRLIRLKKAAELIQEGKHLIGDICFMVGINSPSYFGKLFAKQFGMTPKEFEKHNRIKKNKIKIELKQSPNEDD